jgi:membrane protein implicated in regulation of membrane protease activity
MAGVVLAWFLTRMPWWGVAWLASGGPLWIARILQNSYLLGALVALGLLWRVVPRSVTPTPGDDPPLAVAQEKRPTL